MTFIKNFKSTNIWKAFILNSLVSTITILMAIILKSQFDKYTFNSSSNSGSHNSINLKTSWIGIIITLIFTFFASFLSYTFLHIIFGYGNSLIITK